MKAKSSEGVREIGRERGPRFSEGGGRVRMPLGMVAKRKRNEGPGASRFSPATRKPGRHHLSPHHPRPPLSCKY